MLLLLLSACQSGPDYGPFTPSIRIHQESLVKDPCNESAVTELAKLMESAGAIADAVEPVRAYTATCKPSVEFEEFQLGFAARAGQWPMALAIGDRRVAADPTVPGHRVTRGELRAQAGDLAGAVADLRQAALLQPSKSRPEALKRLAEAQTQAGQPCDAWISWKTLSQTSRELRGEAQLAGRKLLEDPACAGFDVVGEAKLKRSDHATWWLFPVTLDGKPMGLGADTGAPISVLSRESAAALGVSGDGQDWYVRGFAGTLAGPMHRVAVLEVAGLKVPVVDFVIVEELPDGLPGMMGADLLSRIGFREVKGLDWVVEGI